MSLTTRALVAILLMIGFYVFSLAVVAGLIWIPYAEWHYFDRIHPKLAIGCLVAAFLILVSIVPRRDKFEAPGPRITEDQQPRLFAELKQIASQTGQTLPHEVYFIPDVNAWVSQRGGWMGFGSHRVMGLGVPLMRLLTVSEFRGVLAHEFGHYVGGDTALSPWVYKTRAAIGRTLMQLQEANSIVVVLFNWYGNMFLRVTLAISRAQEYAADVLGAKIAGARAMIEGLKKVHMGGAAWEVYFRTEVVPLLDAGFSPPLSVGLQKFLDAPAIKEQATAHLQKELLEGKAEKFDSHPALPQRIAALEALQSSGESDSRPATELIDNYGEVDASLFAAFPGVALKPIDWESALQQVYVAEWRTQVGAQKEALSGLTVETLGKQLYSWELRNRLKFPPGIFPSNEQRDPVAKSLAGCALALTLMTNGWTLTGDVGEPVQLRKGDVSLKPFEIVHELATAKIKPEQWTEQCAQWGISALPVAADSAAKHASGSIA